MKIIRSQSQEETFGIGRRVGAQLQPGAVVALYGQLGVGKTQLAKGIGAALGVDPDRICSPTFTVCNTCAGRKTMLHHFDLYRLQSVEELEEIGFQDYLNGQDILVIEWGEKAEEILPVKTTRIYLDHTKTPNEREIRIAAGLFPQ